MKRVNLSFPDGVVRSFDSGVTMEQVARALSPSLKKQAVAGKINGNVVDLMWPIQNDGEIEVLTADSEEGLKVIRHSTAHLMAQALKRIFKEEQIHLGVGPAIENGFYYDIDMERSLSQDDLQLIEKEMRKIVEENLLIERREVTREEALRRFEEIGDSLKIELLKAIPEGEPISIYEQGEFFDLCRGPHVPSTGKLKVFKLMSVAGAYWRGDSTNQMLQRVYGVAFSTKSELNDYLQFIEEAQKRDHRKLGKELELFMISEEAPGMPFFLPKGQTVRNELEKFSREFLAENGYQEVRTPFMMNQRMWEKSGHWDHYHENMYFSEVDDMRFALKPMNCPGHMLIFKNKLRSYRELPLRLAEFGQCHRHEFSGALSGLTRVRTFCQDDAHLFVRPSQIESEIQNIIKLIDRMYGTLGFSYEIELSTRPEDSMGEDHLWEQAEAALRRVLVNLQLDYRLNEGDGAFYGPKIDFHIQDALKRSHQCATIQLDFQMPEKFDLTYVDEHNEKARPVVIHRAVFGSIDRFFGILIEHFSGAFPTWLAPVQAKILPVAADAHLDYAKKVGKQLRLAGVRVEVDERNEKIGYKIREAQTQKIPYMLVAGDKEIEADAVNVRKYGEQKSESVLLEQFIGDIKKEIEERRG